MSHTTRYSDLKLYRRLLGQARPYWPHVAGIVVLNLLSSSLVLLSPLPWKIAVDSILDSRPLPGSLENFVTVTRSETVMLALVAALVVLLALLKQLEALASSLLQSYTGEKLVLDFRARLFRHIQRLSVAYHDVKGTADSTYRIQYDARSIEHVLVTGQTSLISSTIMLTGMIYVTAWLDWQLASVGLAVLPILVLINQASRRRLRKRWPEVKEHESSAMSVVQEVLGAVRVVKAFGQEDREHDRFVHRSRQGLRGTLHLALIQGVTGLLVGLTTATGTAAVLFVGVRHVQSGILTLGDLFLVMAYLSRLYVPLEVIGSKMGDLQSALASAERAFSLLDEMPDVVERLHPQPIRRAVGEVTFRNVAFCYASDRPVLHGISFGVASGMHIGIAGTTGAGKTTLMSLLCRFYDPTDGQILLDGLDLREYKLADLRNQFGIVLQEPLLFSASIAENIAYARPEATKDEIVAAAKAANAHDFIVRFPGGYESRVGERGMRLSGGERQRISLARAFLKDAPILVLDEPTSSVDAATEASIAEAMQRLIQDRTSFIISHRPSVLERCDLLLIIEDGRLKTVRSGGQVALEDPLSIAELGAQVHGRTV